MSAAQGRTQEKESTLTTDAEGCRQMRIGEGGRPPSERRGGAVKGSRSHDEIVKDKDWDIHVRQVI